MELGHAPAGTIVEPAEAVLRYLVVANQTLGGPQLTDWAGERIRWRPSRFHVLVPAAPRSEDLVWTEGAAHQLARRRLARAMRRLGDLGVEVSGEVGDADPILAIADVLMRQSFDEIMLFTLRPGFSRWFRVDLPRRAARRFPVVVTPVIAAPEPGPFTRFP
jgi:hypothetical protein